MLFRSEECGWRRVTYEGGKAVKGEGHEGIASGETFEDGLGAEVY